uniref:Uncharacterized protein n=1 Tax=Scleropages formosus TaxID=113540 RepID=A0A8C9R951_SCLFO
MGRVIRGQRKGAGFVFRAHVKHRKGATKLQHFDFTESPLPKVVFHDPYRFKKRTKVFIAAEGIHTRQFTCCGKQGYVLPVGAMPNCTIICCLKRKPGDWDKPKTWSQAAFWLQEGHHLCKQLSLITPLTPCTLSTLVSED